MQVGLVGVGKMGAGILRRWQKSGADVVAFDVSPNSKKVVEDAGGVFAEDLKELVSDLATPRTVWLMVPAGAPVSKNIVELAGLLQDGDIVIDGGNSNYKDSMKHAALLDKKNINFIDAGVSGGVAGEQTGYALMVGGAKKTVETTMPLFKALAAGKAFLHVGPAGAGHYVKMVHNAIEYGIMQAMGEGFDLLKNGPFENLDLHNIAGMWSHGTIIRSYLMELTAKALEEDGELKDIAAHVDDSGEGRWSVDAAVEHAVPFWANTAALYARFDSRQADNFSHKLIAALRKEFGGHAVKKT